MGLAKVNMWKCPKCGAPNPVSIGICYSCKARRPEIDDVEKRELSAADNAPPAPPDREQPTSSGSPNPVPDQTAGWIVLVIIGVIIYSIWLGIVNKPKPCVLCHVGEEKVWVATSLGSFHDADDIMSENLDSSSDMWNSYRSIEVTSGTQAAKDLCIVAMQATGEVFYVSNGTKANILSQTGDGMGREVEIAEGEHSGKTGYVSFTNIEDVEE